MPKASDLGEMLLRMMKDTYVAMVQDRNAPDLSARQMAIVLICYDGKQSDQTVRGLAVRLDINKSAVTRALDRLTKLGLITRKKDPMDRRSVHVRRTTYGPRYIASLRQKLMDAMPQSKSVQSRSSAKPGVAAHPA